MMRTIVVSLGIALAAFTASCNRDASRESTASYPARDVTIIVPFGAGGGSDVLSRTIANVLRELKLVPVNLLVENRPVHHGGSSCFTTEVV